MDVRFVLPVFIELNSELCDLWTAIVSQTTKWATSKFIYFSMMMMMMIKMMTIITCIIIFIIIIIIIIIIIVIYSFIFYLCFFMLWNVIRERNVSRQKTFFF